MGLRDFEVFLQERARSFDETLDISSGSPFDTELIQPILRRLGVDPFTVDAATFITTRLTQEFPDLAQGDGDAVSDLLVKPFLLLFDPVIREVQRVKNVQSFKDPSTLTTDEAEALGANLFAERERGDFARGTARIYYAQPQQSSITQSNFVTSRSGLHYFPTDVQSIKPEEMILNKEGELYYFDISVIAERAGEEYNIESGELVSIANVSSAVRVTNKARFRSGLAEEDAVTYVGRAQQELTERSLVTLRGILARLQKAFPAITRIAVSGFNDPEMLRDVVTGGSLGPIAVAGFDAQTAADGEYKARSRRVQMLGADFNAAIGPVGPVRGFVLTLFDMFGANPPLVRDLEVVRVIDATTLEVEDQVLFPGAVGKSWTLRRRELRLSHIPGGILFPDSPNGTVGIPEGQVHIGGCTDMFTRGSDFDAASVVLDSVTDDSPLLSGQELAVIVNGSPPPANLVELQDITLGVDYQIGDATYEALENARTYQYSLQILEGAAAGVYRVLDVTQVSSARPVLSLDPVPPAVSGTFRWRLLDELDINLVEPKETRVHGTTGQTIQNVDLFSASPAIDFDALGVSVGDILRVMNGPDAGDFTVTAIISPFFTQVQVDRPFTRSQSGLSFAVFRPNTGGGVKRPLTRITSIDLLDTTGQPVGSKVPYAKPVEIRSRAFQNPGNGDKVSVQDASLGLVSLVQPGGGFVFGGGGNILLTWDGLVGNLTIPLAGTLTASQVVAAANVASQSLTGLDVAVLLTYGGVNRIGFIPIGPKLRLVGGSTSGVLTALFGNTEYRTSRDIRSASVASWSAITPTLDQDLDVAWVLDGVQSGFYEKLVRDATASGLSTSTALQVSHDFAPELARAVRVGSRSIGSARLYFLEPTSVEVDSTTRFTTTNDAGIELRFKPDPTLRHQLVPPMPNGDKPNNGLTSSANLTSTGIDFVKKGVREGDLVAIDYVPLTGLVSLTDPVANLALKDLRISLDSQPDKVVTFINDVLTPNAVSREGVASQINSAVGINICSIVEVTTGDFRLRFNPEVSLVLRQQSSNPNQANTLVGFSNVSDTNNNSPNKGEYTILLVGPPNAVDTITLDSSLTTAQDQQFKIYRRGMQRIVSTKMSENAAEAGLYFWDVELVSEGVGDLWNIDADAEMTASNYRSDGYYLTTRDKNTTFSEAEDITLRISRSILEVGTDDDPENATQLSGQSLSINYEYSTLVQNVQSFASSETERVINENPLSRHLVPHFVRFDLTYSSGSRESEILPLVESYIRELLPDDALESSDVQKIVSGKGATSIQNPIDLLAVVHDFDRSVRLARSQDSLSTGRLAAFIPDAVTLKRRVS